MSGIYYDPDGQPITMDEWARVREAGYAARRAHPSGESTPEDDPTRIGSDHIGSVWVSTVWLGLDLSVGGPPTIFETMVFGGPLDQTSDRYSTKEEARAGHEATCERVRSAQRATAG